MQQRERSHWVRNYEDGGNVHDFAQADLLRYRLTMAERIVGLGYAFGNYINDTSECFHLMGLGNRYSPSSHCT